MELNIFMRELESALVARGIPEDAARKHVASLQRTFTADDLSEIEAIQSKAEVEQLAAGISGILNRKAKSDQAAAVQNKSDRAEQAVKQERADVNPPQRAVAKQNPKPIQAPVSQLKPVRQDEQPNQPLMASQVKHPKQTVPQNDIIDDDDDYFEYSALPEETTKGIIIFWLGLFLTLPISIALTGILFGTFAVLFVGLGALIVGLIGVLVAVAAAGAGVSLVGIIFGITQLFSFVAAGIYEIGLGIMVAGAALFISVLIYNIAIRLLPWIIVLLGNFLGFVCKKLKGLFLYIRRECYKL